MKKLVILLFLFNTFEGYAQDKIEVVEKDITMGKKALTAFVFNVGHNPQTVKKSFARYCKDHLKIKIKSEGKDRLVAAKVNIPAISDKTGDLRAMVFQENKIPKMAVGFTVGYDLFINSKAYPQEAARLKEFVRKYAIYHESKYFYEILDENQRRLDDLVKNLENSEKEVKSLTSRIRKIDKTIRKEQDPNKKFDLDNQNIANRARVQAVSDIVVNLKAEIVKMDALVEKTKVSLKKLESQTY